MAIHGIALLALATTQLSVEAFSQNDNGAWNARFAELHADLYTAPLPAALEATCKSKGKYFLTEVTVTGNKRSSELAATCGPNNHCTILGDVDVDEDWNVGALTINRRAVDVRRRPLPAGVRVERWLRVRRLLNRDAYTGVTLPTHRIRDFFSPAPPCAFAY